MGSYGVFVFILGILAYTAGWMVGASTALREQLKKPIQFEEWIKEFGEKNKCVRRTWYGYKVWALQNRHDGHCIMDAKVRLNLDGTVNVSGWSEHKIGERSQWTTTAKYTNVAAFESNWGLK